MARSYFVGIICDPVTALPLRCVDPDRFEQLAGHVQPHEVLILQPRHLGYDYNKCLEAARRRFGRPSG